MKDTEAYLEVAETTLESRLAKFEEIVEGIWLHGLETDGEESSQHVHVIHANCTQDNKLLRLLLNFMAPFCRSNDDSPPLISIWHSDLLQAGEEYEKARKASMQHADYCLALFSPDFIADKQKLCEFEEAQKD